MKSIFVGNLSFSTTEDEIRGLFEAYGTVDRVSIITDRDTGRSRGFAFVEMGNDQEAEAAITATNGSSLSGRTLNVNEARPRAERGPSGPPRSGFARGGRNERGGGGRAEDYRGHARQPREPRW